MISITCTEAAWTSRRWTRFSNRFSPPRKWEKIPACGAGTVYGIVKQNSGFINVYREPGQGATFRIYLPRVFFDQDAESDVREKIVSADGTETILSAATPSEAVEKAKNYSGSIDLLMTDVVMPEMNGRDPVQLPFAAAALQLNDTGQNAGIEIVFQP